MHKRLFVRFVRWVGYDLGISPNQITLGRLFFFVPGWLAWFYRQELAVHTGLPWQVIGAFAIVAVSTVILFDVVDGALARETGQVSDQGKILDPLADKLITYSTLGLFWGAIDHLGLLILFLLDLASTLLRGVQVEGANHFGKFKALAQNIAKIFFAFAVLCATPFLNIGGNALIWMAVGLASISVGVRILPAKIQSSILVAIPQILTLSNLGAGVTAIWCATQGKIGLGVAFSFAAMFFDLSDGAVARKLGVSSTFGKQFDTIADMVSFGLAPAVIVCSTAGWSILPMSLGAFYVAATLFRLYDYGRSKDRTPKGFFRGLPSPAAAWVVISSVLFPNPSLSLLILVAAAILMCSFRINWIHFNQVIPTIRSSEIIASLTSGLILALATHTAATLFAAPIIVYVFSPIWRKPLR
ncbi:MAG: CDP-alcohol phosphatidyltransferase family protein [Desulfobulbaceae bacterium]|nr:CDP-alcohol phosphatidyltransferase family protein [Desulfobulbaceae bacterium]